MNENHARTRRGRRGFTLIEMILVVVIIALLAALVLTNFAGRSQQAREAAAETQVATFRTALAAFETDCGRYPTSEEGLRALIEKPAGLPETAMWRPYLEENRIPEDPWGNEYVYRNPGTINTGRYDLLSPGPDGEVGTDDDIGTRAGE
jgi:general secretion pathway protein G